MERRTVRPGNCACAAIQQYLSIPSGFKKPWVMGCGSAAPGLHALKSIGNNIVCNNNKHNRWINSVAMAPPGKWKQDFGDYACITPGIIQTLGSPFCFNAIDPMLVNTIKSSTDVTSNVN